MRFFALIFFCALAYAALPMQRADAVISTYMPGDACSPVGKTVKSSDDKNILACVCDSDSAPGACDLHWKMMTIDVLTNGTFNCPAGQAIDTIIDGVPHCAAY